MDPSIVSARLAVPASLQREDGEVREPGLPTCLVPLWMRGPAVQTQGKVVLPTMQASLSARKLGYWEIRGCCGRRWRDVNLKTPIYYKYYV